MAGTRASLTIAAVALAGGLTPVAGRAEAVPVDVVLVIAVDVSASMERDEFLLQRAGYVETIRDRDFIRTVRADGLGRIALTYVEWSGAGQQKVVVPWRLIDGAASANAFAEALDAAPFSTERGTSISAALAFSAGLIRSAPFDGDRKVIDISGDGPNNYGPSVTEARDEVVRQGIVVNGLPILISPSPIFPAMDDYYADCVIGGAGAFVLPVVSVGEFAIAIRRKLLREVAARPPPAAVVPVSAAAPVDCQVGEEARQRYADPYLPGLDK